MADKQIGTQVEGSQECVKMRKLCVLSEIVEGKKSKRCVKNLANNELKLRKISKSLENAEIWEKFPLLPFLKEKKMLN